MDLKRLTVWVWVVVGLREGQSVQLSEIANHIPGDTQAVGRIARVRRFLASKWIVSCRLLRLLISCATPPPCTLRLNPFKPEPVRTSKC
jgi:hypothetical protein